MALVKPIPIQNATITYGAEYFWRILDDLFSEGTVASTDLTVQAVGTPDMSVNVLAGQAYVDFDSPDKGKKMVWNDATNNSGTPGSPGADWLATFTAAHGSLPRIDRVILKVRDNNLDASGAYDAKFQVIAGTATSGATLSNLTGATAVPVNSILLANVLIPAASSSITAGNIDSTSGTVRPLARIGAGRGAPPATSDWTAAGGTWTFNSATDAPSYIASINADMTAILQKGTRILLTQSSTPKYFIVTNVGAFSGGNTLVTLLSSMTAGVADNSGLANSAITNPLYSNMYSPFGFPTEPIRWTLRLSDVLDRSQASPGIGTWYNPGAVSLVVPPGAWKLSLKGSVRHVSSGGGAGGSFALSASASTPTDTDLQGSAGYADVNLNDIRLPVYVEKNVTLAIKTTYFAILKRTFSSSGSMQWAGATEGATVIEAACAYLGGS